MDSRYQTIGLVLGSLILRHGLDKKLKIAKLTREGEVPQITQDLLSRITELKTIPELDIPTFFASRESEIVKVLEEIIV